MPEVPAADEPLGQGRLHYVGAGAATARPAMRIAWEQTSLPRRLARNSLPRLERDLQTGRRERLNCGLTSRSGPLHAHVHAANARGQCFARRLFGGNSSGERRGFLGAFEARLAR